MKKKINMFFLVSYFIMFLLVLNAYYNWEQSKLWIMFFYIMNSLSLIFLIIVLIMLYKQIKEEYRMKKKYENEEDEK